MKVKHGCGKTHEVYLCDDGTMDTVIEVDGSEIRYDCDYAASYRSDDGAMTREGLRSLAIEACEMDLIGEEELES